MSLNLHRRHLNESQRAMVAAKMSTGARGGDRGNQHTGGKGSIGSLPQDEAAKLLNVSPKSVQRAKQVQQKGTPETIAAVESGVLPVSVAGESKDLTQEEIDRNIIEIVGLAKAIDVAESDLCVDSTHKSKKPNHRPPKAGSTRRASKKTNIPEKTARAAQAHIAAIDKYPQLKAIVRGAHDRATIAKNLDKLPEDERAEALDGNLSPHAAK